MIRARTIATVSMIALAASAACTAGPDLDARRWIDLSHTFDAETIYWPTAGGFALTVDSRGMTDNGYWYEANTLRTAGV